MTQPHGWGRDVFGFAIALQNLFWGVAQPFAGAVADRFGVVRVLCVGTLMYAARPCGHGLRVNAVQAATTAGALIGLGLSGCSFNLVLGAFGKLLPERWRRSRSAWARRLGHSVSFCSRPSATSSSMLRLAARARHLRPSLLLILPLSLPLATRAEPKPAGAPAPAPIDPQRFERSLPPPQLRAARARLLHLRLPARLHYDAHAGLSQGRRPSRMVGGWTLAVIGLANIAGSLSPAGCPRACPTVIFSQPSISARSLAIAAFILLPASPLAAIAFGTAMGFLWLSTVPPTSAW